MLFKDGKRRGFTIIIILGILMTYINQMAVSPILSEIRDAYAVSGESQLNLLSTIMYPSIILFSVLGSVQKRIGTKRLYSLCLFLTAIGMGMCFFAHSYATLLLARLIFGAGFGLGIPFIGNAISAWYPASEQETMNTVNGLFPLVGTLICFAVSYSLYKLLGYSVQRALGVWCVPSLILLVLWCFTKEPETLFTEQPQEKHSLIGIFKNRDIRRLCIAFICDFFCYAYIATILPVYFDQAFGIGAGAAGILAAFSFPAVGIAGGLIGGRMMSAKGLRKPPMLCGQLLKFFGLVLLAAGSKFGIALSIVGTVLFGLGNSMWMPGMYMAAMEQPGMTPQKTGLAFSVISSCGFAAGFISPVLGGFLVDRLSLSGRSYVSASNVCILLFSLTNIPAFFAISAMRETGKSNK